MQVAVCLSGHLRSFELTWRALQKFIIQPLSASVFIHTWDSIGISSHIDGKTTIIRTNNLLREIYSRYNAKQVMIEPLNKIQGEQYRKYLIDKRSPVGVTNMFYKIYKADQLRQNDYVKYDLVIRARPDALFNAPINIEYISQAMEENCLFLPDCGHFSGINDQFAFGPSEVMKIYANCFNELNQLTLTTPFVPERILKEHLLKSNISIKFFPINYDLIRVNGALFDNKTLSPGIPELK